MLDRVGGFVFVVYFLLIGSTAFAIVRAVTFVTELPRPALKAAAVSRVQIGLQAQERIAAWQAPPAAPLVPANPGISVEELTQGLEEAEGHSPALKKPRPARVAAWAHREKSGPRRAVLCYDFSDRPSFKRCESWRGEQMMISQKHRD